MKFINEIEYKRKKKEFLQNFPNECKEHSIVLLSAISEEDHYGSGKLSFSIGKDHIVYKVVMYYFSNPEHSWRINICGNGFRYGINKMAGVTAHEVTENILICIDWLSVGKISFTKSFRLVERTAKGSVCIGIGVHPICGSPCSIYVYYDDLKRLGLKKDFVVSDETFQSEMQSFNINHKYITEEEYEGRTNVIPINQKLAMQVIISVYEEKQRWDYVYYN